MTSLLRRTTCLCVMLLAGSPASAQGKVRVLKDQSVVWNMTMATPITALKAGTVLDVGGRDGEFYVVKLPPIDGRSAGTGRIAMSQVEWLDGAPPAPSAAAGTADFDVRNHPILFGPKRPVGQLNFVANSVTSPIPAPSCPLCAGKLTTTVGLGGAARVAAQNGGTSASAAGGSARAPATAVVIPLQYVIGVGDVLAVRFWRHNEVSGDVIVRPDGKISLLLLDDVDAAGSTPEELRDRIAAKADRFFEDTQVTVIVKEINSRLVFITGMVAKPGPYPLRGPMTVLQLIATAGGLLEYAHKDQIVIMRSEAGKQTKYLFNYDSMAKRADALDQNIELKPGDTVVVP